jgi:hypothetical protein
VDGPKRRRRHPYAEFPACASPAPEDWAAPLFWIFDNPVQVQDAHENNLDPAHMVYLHGGSDIPLDPEMHEFIHDEDSPSMRALLFYSTLCGTGPGGRKTPWRSQSC